MNKTITIKQNTNACFLLAAKCLICLRWSQEYINTKSLNIVANRRLTVSLLYGVLDSPLNMGPTLLSVGIAVIMSPAHPHVSHGPGFRPAALLRRDAADAASQRRPHAHARVRVGTCVTVEWSFAFDNLYLKLNISGASTSEILFTCWYTNCFSEERGSGADVERYQKQD